MCCCLCLIFVVFPLKSKVLMEPDFFSLPVFLQNLFLVWLLFCMDMCVFPHSNISEIIGLQQSLIEQRGLWCCNVNSVWFRSWLLLTSALSKKRCEDWPNSQLQQSISYRWGRIFLFSSENLQGQEKNGSGILGFKKLPVIKPYVVEYCWLLLKSFWALQSLLDWNSQARVQIPWFFGPALLSVEERWDRLLIRCRMRMGPESFWQ